MPFEINCPECQTKLRLGDEHEGMQAQCPKCSATFVATRPSSPAASATSTPAPMDPNNPYAAPSSYAATTSTETGGDGEWSPRKIDSGDVIARAWAIFKEQWVMACVTVLIVGGINFVISQASSLIVQAIAMGGGDVAIVIVVNFVFTFGGWLVQIWLGIGQTMVLLDIARGEQVQVGKVFGGLPYMLNTLGAVLLLMVMIFGILLVCVGIPLGIGAVAESQELMLFGSVAGIAVAAFPIIYLSLMYSQIQVLVIDRGLAPLEALSVSKEITEGNKLTLFVIGLILFLIGLGAMIVGFLALCIGIIPAMIGFSGYSALTLVVAYLQMTGQYVTGD